jgi:hypothetical protein
MTNLVKADFTREGMSLKGSAAQAALLLNLVTSMMKSISSRSRQYSWNAHGGTNDVTKQQESAEATSTSIDLE